MKENEWIIMSERVPDVLYVRILLTDGSELNVLSQLDGDFYFKMYDMFIVSHHVRAWKHRPDEEV
jgi:hypothetical protein